MPKPIQPTRGADDLTELYSFFAGGNAPSAEVILTDQMPEPYRTLLAHENHMTVTLEEHCGGPLNVTVVDQKLDGAIYARKSILSCATTGRIVQFGIMRIDLKHCPEAVAEKILSGRIPLGRVLIEHNILRRVTTEALLRITPDGEMMRGFGLDELEPVYGRLATIHWNDEPAVDLLEVLAPV